MKKKFILFLLVLFSSGIFASGGLMSGGKKRYKITTKYFDIIYCELTEESALKLSKQCDEIYEKICSDFFCKEGAWNESRRVPQFRMTVSVVPASETFNAYFTNFPKNHIVLFDTLPEDSLNVFSDSLTGTFVHELTHAVTTNTSGKALRTFQNIFGDVYNLGYYLYMTSFFCEGSAVYEESAGSEGRLNDGFYLHKHLQAKLNGNFPSYADVTGSRDIVPYDTAYAFGGPFTQYLADTYGKEKLSQLWFNSTSSPGFSLTYKGVFKKTYGISVEEAWENFCAQIQVPKVNANPLESGAVDFFNGSRKFSMENLTGSQYVSLTQNENSFAYIDKSESAVYLAELKNDGTFSSPKKLFEKTNISKINLSRDGSLLSFDFYNTNSAGIKTQCGIYDIEKDKFYFVHENGLRNSAVVKNKDGIFLAAVKVQGQKSSLKVFKFKDKKFIPESEIPVGKDSSRILTNIIPFKNSAAFILKDKMEWYIGIASDLKNLSSAEFFYCGKNIRLRNLNCQKDILSFSYVEGKSFPRLGFIDFTYNNEGIFYFQQNDISGGVYYPLLFKDEDENFTCIYSGNFVHETRLLQIPLVKKTLSFKTEKSCGTNLYVLEKNNLQAESTSSSQNEFTVTRYSKPFEFKGVLFPLCILAPAEISGFLNSFDFSPDTSFNAGFTYCVDNPYDSFAALFSGGYNLEKKYFSLGAVFQWLAQTSVYNIQFTPQVFFYEEGFLQTYDTFDFSSTVYTKGISRFTFQESNSFIYGKIFQENSLSQEKSFWKRNVKDEIIFEENYYYDENKFSIYYSTLRKAGNCNFEKKGIQLGLTYHTVFCGTQSKEANLFDADWVYENNRLYQNIYPSVYFYLPHLIPVKNLSGFCYNFPFAFGCELLNSSSNFLVFEGETVLFGIEIQKGSELVPLYLSRIFLSASYYGMLSHLNGNFEIKNIADDFKTAGEMEYYDRVQFKLMFECAYNSGALASSDFVLKAGLTASYYPYNGTFKMGLGFSSMF
ncbi:MAG: hypothetical protein PUI24_04515 [Spirochaetales bacterium]|nr:hypothetical protein [Spirochaetales bacterium]